MKRKGKNEKDIWTLKELEKKMLKYAIDSRD